MNLPRITTEGEWLAAREAMRAAGEKLLAAHDRLSSERRSMPMVEVIKQRRGWTVVRSGSGLDRFGDLVEVVR